MQPDMDPIEPARIEWSGATPAAPRFDDTYYSVDGGLAESRAVFIDANRLAPRFEALSPGDRFVIGETGFGTGLNLLLAADLFLERAQSGARLHLVSAEKHPLSKEDLQRALSAWPELGGWAARLVDRWPPSTCGFHRVDLDERIDLTLMLGDARVMWAAQDALVDAWFLDGFAPSRNASMWTPELFQCLRARSRPGATLATFTAAGDVRRGLDDAGFEVRRRPGFGRKRHRLEGSAPGTWQPQQRRSGHALIVGAGLAGCTTAHALARRGWSCRVIDAGDVAGAASGNRVGVVYTTPSGQATPQNRFYQASWLNALRWLRRCGADELGRFDGVEQHVTDARHRRKLDDALKSGHWPSTLLQRLDDDRVLLVPGGVIRPPAWCERLLALPGIEVEARRTVRTLGDGASLTLDDGRRLDADAVVLCTAAATRTLLPGAPLPIRAIRGQVTEVATTPASRSIERAICHTGYIAPAIDGIHLVGATFDLHFDGTEPRDGDDAANLDTLRRWRPEIWDALGGAQARVVGRRVGFRCASRDYLPLAGPADADGSVWLSVAHGSRGISGTPLAADRIADALAGAPSPIDASMARALAPTRFA